MKKNKNTLIIFGIFLIVLCNSIVYGALNTDMFIDGDAYVRVDRNIRVTGIKVLEQNNGAYETYNCDYSKDTTSIQVALPSSDSSIVYEVTITNKGDIDYEVSNIIEESYSNSNIKYEVIELEKGTVIDGETTCTFKIKLTTTENNSENKGTLVLKYAFQEWVPTLYNMVVHKSRSLDTDIDFGVAPTKETSGVYEMDSTKDDEYPVYYYRGIVENNNVSFAGFCWKMVRTTSTGGVKLIYNGVPASDGSCDNTGEASTLGTSAYNIDNHNSSDISYVYDNGNDSEIKKVIDKWYSDNMLEYTNMLEDTEWCNDRSIYSTDERGRITYNAYYRNNVSFKFELNCQNVADRFTVSESNGNGRLTYPVALLTADEATLAGVTPSNYSSFSYYNEGIYEWHMSPRSYTVAADGKFHSFMFIFSNVGDTTAMYARPSISLVSGTMIKEGNGSVSKPYKLVENKIPPEWSFDYTGDVQEFTAPMTGIYKLEVWGAQGGGSGWLGVGGKGGYSIGIRKMNTGEKLYVYVGEQGQNRATGAFNGGGVCYCVVHNCNPPVVGQGGGGATDIRTSKNSNYQDRIIVAGGGGGSVVSESGYGGGEVAGSASATLGVRTTYAANGAVGGNCGVITGGCASASCVNASTGYYSLFTGGGGGGYVGGIGVYSNTTGASSAWVSHMQGSAAGGTGYVGGVESNTKYGIEAKTIGGNQEIPTYDGSSTMTGNSGNGYAKITIVK